MATFGTDSSYGVPVHHKITIDGTEVDEQIQFRISDVNNSSDPINGKRKISDLSISLIDHDSDVWTNHLGNGTAGFGKEVEVTTYVGGTMGYIGNDLGTSWGYIGTDGANSFTTHKGKIVYNSRSSRLTNIRSQNKMNLLPKLKWQHPVQKQYRKIAGSFYGKYCFFNQSDSVDFYQDALDNSGYGFNETNDQWKFVSYPYTGYINTNSYLGTGIYDTTDGTGIAPILSDDYAFIDTRFTQEYEAFTFKGTRFGTKFGTISTEDNAKKYGYTDLEDAESNINKDDSGTYYVINKVRAEWPDTADSTRDHFHNTQNMDIQGDPTAVLRHMLFGKMVTDYYDQDTDMETTSFEEAARITAFNVSSRTVVSKENDTDVEGDLDDIIKNTSALFFVDTNNQFRYIPHSSFDYTQTLEDVGTESIISASYTNDVNDSFNRIVLRYKWDAVEEQYAESTQGSLTDWDISDDRLLEMESKWTSNNNQASSQKNRLLSRYENTNPKITFTVPLTYAGRELGSFMSISETETGMTNRTVQVIGYKKGFSSSKTITFDAYDGEAVYNKRGYARFEGDETGPDLSSGKSVSGTSTSGWGTTVGGIGTTFGINEDLYGTQFVWF